jgi:hypothetical protein
MDDNTDLFHYEAEKPKTPSHEEVVWNSQKGKMKIIVKQKYGVGDEGGGMVFVKDLFGIIINNENLDSLETLTNYVFERMKVRTEFQSMELIFDTMNISTCNVTNVTNIKIVNNQLFIDDKMYEYDSLNIDIYIK